MTPTPPKPDKGPPLWSLVLMAASAVSVIFGLGFLAGRDFMKGAAIREGAGYYEADPKTGCVYFKFRTTTEGEK